MSLWVEFKEYKGIEITIQHLGTADTYDYIFDYEGDTFVGPKWYSSQEEALQSAMNVINLFKCL